MAARKVTKTRFPGIYEVTGGREKRYMVSYRVPGAGQRTKTVSTLSEAKEFQGRVRDPARARQMRQLDQGRIRLVDYFTTWLGRKRNLTPSTRLRYEGVGRKYICAGRLGLMPLSQISRDDVEDWLSELVDRGVPRPTIDKSYRTLRACLESAVLEGKALSNPARRISTPALDEREPFFLSAVQVELVAREVPPRHRALVYFLAYTGVRMGEATALKVKNLDLPHARVGISESSVEVAGRKLPSAKTKTKKARTIRLSEELASELAGHLHRFGVWRDGVVDPESYVFIGERGSQIRQGNWRERVFQPACMQAGITRRTQVGGDEVPRVHDLRHTAASLAAKAGYSLHEVKDMLGHSTIKTTADRYLHLFDETRLERASSLGQLLKNAREAGTSVVPLGVASGLPSN